MTGTERRRFLKTASRAALGLAAAPALSMVAAGCKTMSAVTDVGTSIGVAAGVIDSSQAESIKRTSGAVARTFEDITPEQEYYIGRSVGAVILSKYPPYKNSRANSYVNLVGQTVARASDLPETFGGYHFLIQDSDEINALAAPGGLIFITRGMLRCCKHEDAVAAVLAHEVGHVQGRHGLQAIKKSRITNALTTIGMESAKTFGGEQLASLTEAFEGTVSDVTQSLINKGYSRGFEREADLAAVTILKRVGYSPGGLIDMLQVMEERLKPGRLDFASTHPSPASRISDLRRHIGGAPAVTPVRARHARFQAALGSV